MKGAQLIVVDWTSSAAQVGVFAGSLRGFELQSEFSVPTRTVLRHERSGTIRHLVGDDAVGLEEDEHTIVFDQPARDLPKIENPDLQTELLKSFWHGLHQSLEQRGVLSAGQDAAVYVIPPLPFPSTVLEKFRSCANETSLRLAGFTNPAIALVLGILSLEESRHELAQGSSSEQVTVWGVVVNNEATVAAVCFDYKSRGPAQHRIIIRDFFQTTVDGLLPRLNDSDCCDCLDVLLLLENPGLSDSVKARLTVSIGVVTGAAQLKHWQSPATSQLKLIGCAEFGWFAAGRATEPYRYELSHAQNLGVQINLTRFHPIISKEKLLQFCEFPIYSAQPFKVRGEPSSALRLNFCCGYSTRVAEATALGHVVLSQFQLAAISRATSLTAAIRLDAAGSGEFFLGLMPENQVLRRQSFMLPELIWT